MSERQEHRKRLNARLEYASKIEKWAAQCPSVLTFWKVRKWLKEMSKKTF